MSGGCQNTVGRRKGWGHTIGYHQSKEHPQSFQVPCSWFTHRTLQMPCSTHLCSKGWGDEGGYSPSLHSLQGAFYSFISMFIPSSTPEKQTCFLVFPCLQWREREQSSSAQKYLGGILLNTNIKRLAQGHRENQWQNEQANCRKVITEECSANRRYVHPTSMPCILTIHLPKASLQPVHLAQKKSWSRGGKSCSVSCKCLTV